MKLVRPSSLVSLFLFTGLVAGGARATAQTLPNGVAAGDVESHKAVLWTRSTAVGDLVFEWSTDPTFQKHVRSDRKKVRDAAVPVKSSLDLLKAGTTYYYRATDAAGATASGTFRTPFDTGRHAGVVFGVSGDSRGDLAPYPSVVNAAARHLDFFADIGDTIYADVESPALPGVAQATTLAEYRQKHAEVLGERNGLNALADLRASTALLAVIDDHEVTDDFAGGAPPASDARFDLTGNYINETNLFTNGLQAFVDYHPIRDVRWGKTGDPRTEGKRNFYRTRHYGSDAEVFVLDARSFRDAELVPANPADPLDVVRFLSQSFDPSRTLLGDAQLAKLEHDLLGAQNRAITWKFVLVPEPIQNFGVLAASDRFEGYAAERSELLAFIVDHAITNVVFVTADIHGTVTNNLTFQRSLLAAQEDAGCFEISVGAIAYDAPFGPTVVGLGWLLGLIDDATLALYLSLPLAAKEGFVTTLIDAQLAPLGYDPIGLDGSSIPATLLAGAWTATHTWGWTEFAVDAATQKLTVTTFGLEPSHLDAEPFVVSQFEVAAR